MGAVPGDGVQAHLLSEKPKVATMATHLNKNGFYWIRKLHKNSFLNIFYLWAKSGPPLILVSRIVVSN